MSLPRETLLELMALADGELDGEALERTERLAATGEGKCVVDAMRAPALGALLRSEMEGRVAAADGIAGAVMAKLEAAQAAQGEGGVVRLSDARARRSRLPVGLTAAGALLVLAASMVLYLRGGADEAGQVGQSGGAATATSQAAPVASVAQAVEVPATSSSSAAAAAVAALDEQGAAPAQGVEVNEIDSPSHDVTVFEIPMGGMAAAASKATPSVVIMIEDDPVKP